MCSTKLLAIPIVLGGPQKVVQIDESLFRHKPSEGFVMVFKNYDVNIFFSIIAGIQPEMRFGFSAWLTFHMIQPQDIWRLCHNIMQQLPLSSTVTWHQVPLCGLINRQCITGLHHSQTSAPTVPLITP